RAGWPARTKCGRSRSKRLGHPDETIALPYLASQAITELNGQHRRIIVSRCLRPSRIDNATARFQTKESVSTHTDIRPARPQDRRCYILRRYRLVSYSG